MAFLTLLLFAAVAAYSAPDSAWNCTTIKSKIVVKPHSNSSTSPISWWKGNCTGTTPAGAVGPITVNILTANLRDPSLILTSLHANTTKGVEALPDMMKQDARVVGGINGGYFFRVDMKDFFDDVCFGKNRQEALQAASASNPNFGIGDGVIVKDGKLIASNCKPLYGYNRPTTLVMNGTQSTIVIQDAGDPPPAGVVNALAAGPNLVSRNASGTFVNIPKDDQNVNILGHSANTAAGLRGSAGDYSELVMVTFDGSDHCLFDPTCGINVYPMAYFMKDYVNADLAMGMDQGGSTTMVVQGEGNADGIVSCSDVPNCGGGGRLLYSGLFVGIE